MVKTVVGRNATILILTLGLVCSKEVFMEDNKRGSRGAARAAKSLRWRV